MGLPRVAAPAPLSLRVEGLVLELPRGAGQGRYRALDSLDLQISSGEAVAIVGASASGKSLVGLALLGLAPPGGRLTARVFEVDGTSHVLSTLDGAGVRGRRIGWVPQSAALSLDPMRTLGAQLIEVLGGPGRAAAGGLAVERALERAGLDPSVASLHPHALSGGMAQRAALALAWVAEPSVLVADEPTTALDGPTRLAVLDALRERVDEGAALALVTHDLPVALHYADRWLVMYGGSVVAVGTAEAFRRCHGHPHVQALFQERVEPPAPDLERERPEVGCAYAPACPRVSERCGRETPRLVSLEGTGLKVACHHPTHEGAV